ncbi:glycosyltransferase family 4 protein [Hymenobacter sp. RP-2-7]|uniref:Glycosyltransferase family 4 protein n=1 Tax=Hymenobacter polaris TaxID=2682546 RepID=A0A7Y0FLA6_9BACT|nr:glycosyltransferase [Hymenobacter polaris]NML64618.1 glycosyltransferase family 4 protein [Hymenobacter polaris]
MRFEFTPRLVPDSYPLRPVLLASVLKPVDDTRMREKFAETILQRPDLRVHVAGRATGDDLPPDLVEAFPRLMHHPIFWGSRLSFNRLRAQLRYWRLLRVLCPALVVVHAPELLPLTLLWQALGRGRQFIYDIQENYALNVATQAVYRGWLKRGLAAGLRGVESLAARRAAALVLAEASYADELPFLGQLPPRRVLVLENKYQPALAEALPTQAAPRPVPGQPLRLLFSGTLSELTGVREALALAEALEARWPGGALLTIIGFCQRPALLAEMQQWAASGRPVRLVGGAQPVPHADIVAEINRSHLGLVLYRPHPSTARCRPTKLFEYLAHGLPILTTSNPLWASLVQHYQAGLALLPREAPAATAERLVAALGPGGPAFYPQGPPREALWASEGKKLGLLLESLLPGCTFAP